MSRNCASLSWREGSRTGCNAGRVAEKQTLVTVAQIFDITKKKTFYHTMSVNLVTGKHEFTCTFLCRISRSLTLWLNQCLGCWSACLQPGPGAVQCGTDPAHPPAGHGGWQITNGHHNRSWNLCDRGLRSHYLWNAKENTVQFVYTHHLQCKDICMELYLFAFTLLRSECRCSLTSRSYQRGGMRTWGTDCQAWGRPESEDLEGTRRISGKDNWNVVIPPSIHIISE